MSRPIVAKVPIRGAANVIERTTIAPMTALSQSHGGSRTPASTPSKPWRATSTREQTMMAAPSEPKAVASSTPIRRPKAPLTATCTEPATPATREMKIAVELADTAASITARIRPQRPRNGHAHRCRLGGCRSESVARPTASWLRASVTWPPEWPLPSSSSIGRWALTSGTLMAGSTSTSRAASGVRTPVTASRLPSRRSTSRWTVTCISASWSACTSPTWRSAAGSPSSRPAAGTNRRACSSTRAPKRSRMRSRSRASRPVVPRKRGFGPFAPEVYRAPAPYPYRGVTSDDAIHGLESLFKGDVDPQSVACVVLEPVQGEGGFIPMPEDFPRRLKELCDRYGILYVDDEVQSGIGRTGPIWAIERYGVEPDLVVSGKSLGGGLPLAAVTGPAEIVDSVAAGGLGGTFGGNPVACAAALAVLDEVATEGFRLRAEAIGERLRAALAGIAGRVDAVGEVRGVGPMLALELVESRETKEPAATLATKTTAAARDRGLILLSCGLYGNVIRILVPLVITDEDLDRGLEILEEALVDAAQRTN